jgi:ribosomal protein S18 acetylase RimI-like enzyme
MIQSDECMLKEIIELSFSKFMGFFAFQSIREDGKVLVSISPGNIPVGFAKLIDFQVNHEAFGCILWVAVHPKFRRRGIASALLKDGVEHLKQDGIKTVFASVQRRNSSSLAVFSQQGFRKVGFVELWHLFGSRIFEFFSDIWLAPGEIVLVNK